MLDSWMKEWGVSDGDVKQIDLLTKSDEIAEILQRNVSIVEQQIRPKGIPTFVYDGGKHLGLFKP